MLSTVYDNSTVKLVLCIWARFDSQIRNKCCYQMREKDGLYAFILQTFPRGLRLWSFKKKEWFCVRKKKQIFLVEEELTAYTVIPVRSPGYLYIVYWYNRTRCTSDRYSVRVLRSATYINKTQNKLNLNRDRVYPMVSHGIPHHSNF
jgi:hypothetical protein